MSTIKYSVIIPAYNIEAFHQQLISYINLIKLKRTDVEFVIINDGSTDKTHDLLKNLPDVCYHKQQNLGVSGARNTGLTIATGEYILFLDADDQLSDTVFEVLDQAIATNEDSNLFIYNYTINGQIVNTNISTGQYLSKWILYQFFTRQINISVCSICYKKSFLIAEELQFMPGYPLGEDIDFFVSSLLALKQKAIYIDSPLLDYLLQTGSVVNSSLNLEKAKVIDLYQKRCAQIEALQDIKLTNAYYYFIQRTYLYLLKKAFNYSISGEETITYLKKYSNILDRPIKTIKLPLIFRVSKTIFSLFKPFIFYILTSYRLKA